ncbi:hypothetical protein ES703_110131 [subsurface metagenome]
MPGTGSHCSEAIGGGTISIIVGVNSDDNRAELSADSFCDFVDFVGQRASVSIAKHEYISTGLGHSGKNPHRIFRICLVAIVEMFGVENSFNAMLF